MMPKEKKGSIFAFSDILQRAVKAIKFIQDSAII